MSSLIKSTTSSLFSSTATGRGGGEMLIQNDSKAMSVQMTQTGFNAMQDQIDGQKAENAVLRQKLRSKAEALVILTQELDKVRFENDEYRDLARKLQTQKASLKSPPTDPPEKVIMQMFDAEPLPETPFQQLTSSFNSRAFRDRTVARKLAELNQENKGLLIERDEIKRNLKEREDDLKLLRSQIKKVKLSASSPPSTKTQQGQSRGTKNSIKKKVGSKSHKAEGSSDPDMIRQLELTQMKYSKLKQDLQSLLDEREDLVQERDAYKCKVHRLNHSMSALLKSDSHKYIDLDCIVAENKFLRENLEQVRQEKHLANEMGRKYKHALEKSSSSARRAPEAEPGGSVKVTDEIKLLLKSTSFPHSASNGDIDVNDTKALQDMCLSLLETLKDRMTQLKQLRRANKQIMKQLEETEERMLRVKPNSTEGVNNCALNADVEDVPIGQMVLRPSEFLMRGYTEAGVDETPSTFFGEDTDDLLLQLHRNPRGVSTHEETICLSDIENDADTGSDTNEDAVELPLHLQNLVERAMEQIE